MTTTIPKASALSRKTKGELEAMFRKVTQEAVAATRPEDRLAAQNATEVIRKVLTAKP